METNRMIGLVIICGIVALFTLGTIYMTKYIDSETVKMAKLGYTHAYTNIPGDRDHYSRVEKIWVKKEKQP